MSDQWIFLSYVLSDALSGYGNGDRVNIQWVSRIDEGKTSNNSALSCPSHFGTHMDYPFHFSADGKSGNDYTADFFVHRNIDVAHIDVKDDDLLVRPASFLGHSFDQATTFFVINTGFWKKRNSDDYWNRNPGMAPELAAFLKQQMPQLRFIGFDSISLSSYQHRETGREAHRKFLSESEILIVEDMDLSQIGRSTELEEVVISPLRFAGADGCPVTILAKRKI